VIRVPPCNFVFFVVDEFGTPPKTPCARRGVFLGSYFRYGCCTHLVKCRRRSAPYNPIKPANLEDGKPLYLRPGSRRENDTNTDRADGETRE
jgi:hypothetical protein